MDRIISVIGGLPSLVVQHDDDFVDRMSHFYTTAIFIVFSVIVSSKQYVGEPINCWVPAHFSGAHEEYANSYCWIRNTYYVPFSEQIPVRSPDRYQHMIPYYQWVPMILLVQALLFYLPVALWRSVCGHSGLDVGSLVSCGLTFSSADLSQNRETMLNYMTKQMDRYLVSQRRGVMTSCNISLKHCFTRTCFRCCGRRHGNYLIAVYLAVKLLFLVNVVGQLFALNLFLGHDFHLFGIDVLRAMIAGNDWTTSSRFPRVTLCDFRIRRLANVQRYTVQCVLPINLFNEKIFLFVWFWMATVAALTALSLCTWVVRVAFRVDRYRYVRRHLRLMKRFHDAKAESTRRQVTGFVDHYLQPDGVFVLRLIGHNTNGLTVTELLCSLWDNYRRKDEISDLERPLSATPMTSEEKAEHSNNNSLSR